MDITCKQAAECWSLSSRRVQMYCPSTPAQQRQLFAEIAHMRGDYQAAVRSLEGILEDEPEYLAALTLAAIARVSSGDASAFPHTWQTLKNLQSRHEGVLQTRAMIELAQGLLAVSAYALEQCPTWLLEGSLDALPDASRPLALYVRAKALLGKNRMDALSGLSETALSLLPGNGIIKAYMHIMSAHAALYHQQIDKAETALKRAIDVCLSLGFVTPLVENISSLLGLVVAASVVAAGHQSVLWG